jgi:8-oxo-dGTP diphosphatase
MKTVVAAILHQDHRVLICQRSLAGSFPGKWEFPGGKLEPGETPQEGLQRELEEELGIDTHIGAEVWRTEHQYSQHTSILLIFYGVDNYRGTEENRVFEKIEWSPLTDLLSFDFLDADRDLVERIAAGAISIPQTRKIET